jgi:hypothetical protein
MRLSITLGGQGADINLHSEHSGTVRITMSGRSHGKIGDEVYPVVRASTVESLPLLFYVEQSAKLRYSQPNINGHVRK